MPNPLWHNDLRVQYVLSPDQLRALEELAPPDMSHNQTAKYLLLLQIDPPAAELMRERAASGMKRLSY